MAKEREGGFRFTQSALFRIGLLLGLVLVIFAFVRTTAVPASFGEYGRYRGDNIAENINKEVGFTKDNSVCGKCHQNEFQTLAGNEHQGLNCESCHGPGTRHTQQPAAVSLKITETAELCSSCHAKIAARSEDKIATVIPFMHSGGGDCAMCHNPHKPWGKIGGAAQ